MKLRHIFTLFVLLLVSLVSKAQERPGWTFNSPKPGNKTYSYRVEFSTGATEDQARNKAFVKTLQSASNSLGVAFDSKNINDAVQQGGNIETISLMNNIPINKVCEYTEKISGGYRVYLLCQVAKKANSVPEYDTFTGCSSVKKFMNGGALIKSAFIPGWGQMSKRRYKEGIITLVGELALVGGSYVLYSSAQDDLAIMNTPDITFAEYKDAKNSYTSNKTLNNAVLGAAVGLYAFNLYRAFASTPKYKNSYAFAPTVLPVNDSYAMGASLTFKF